MSPLDLTQFSVLIVDDDPNNLFTLDALLSERLGVEIVQASNGMGALAVLLERSVDVIILDVQMPGIDGFETASMIKQRKKDADVPIIFLTAAAKRDEDMEKGFDRGAVDYLFKPVDERQLTNKLKGYFRAIDQERQKQNALKENLSETSDELARSETLNERILAAVPQGLVVVQADRIILVNDGFRRMFKGLIETEKGRPVSEVMERLEIPASLQQKMRNREPFSNHELEFSHVGAGALKLVVQVDSIPFDDKLLIVVNNVTEQKLIERKLAQSMEEAQAASRAKSQFLANMSHEFRTPLNGILGLAELIGATPLEADQAQHLELLARSGQRLLRLVSDVLDMSQVEAGTVRLRGRSFELNTLAQDLMDIHGHSARTKGITLEMKSELQGDCWLLADGDRLRQVLVNLIGNGIKFTDRGGVILRLKPLVRKGHKLPIRFEVEDTGIGIPMERTHDLFRRFSQVDDSNTRAFGGTGLGLAISKEICELMGGTIGVESGDGGGSLFWMEIPFETGLSPEQSPASPPTSGPSAKLQSNTHILVVEDDPVNQVVIQAMVENLGCQCTLLPDGEQAVQAVQVRSYDLVLMDLHMPILDGLHATEEIRAWENQAQRKPCPIVALTANVMPGTEADCRAAGMDDYLSKPVRQVELQALIEGLLRPQHPGTTPSTQKNVGHDGAQLNEEHLAYQRETLGHAFSVLINTYLEQTPLLLAELDEALSEEEPAQVWGLAHRLKSSSAQVGATRFSELAKTLESAGRAGRVDLHGEMKQLHQTYGELVPRLQALNPTG